MGNLNLKTLLSARIEKWTWLSDEEWQELGMFGGGYAELEPDEDEYEDEYEE